MIKNILLLIALIAKIACPKGPTVAVFCSGSNDIAPHIKTMAHGLGSFLGTQHYSLITGGGTIGLMKDVVDGYITNLPNAHNCRNVVLRTHSSDCHPALDKSNIIQVDSIHKRIDYIYENADSFVVLPGGFGTLHELLDCFMHNQHTNKPIIIVNIDGFWDNIIQQFNTIIQSNPNASRHLEPLLIANNLSECQLLLNKCYSAKTSAIMGK